jgi:hypothetical protein
MDLRILGCKGKRWMKLARVCLQWRITNVSCSFNADRIARTVSGRANGATLSGPVPERCRATEEKQQKSVTVTDMSNKNRSQYLLVIFRTSPVCYTSVLYAVL